MTLRSSSLNPDLLKPQRSQRGSNAKGILSTTSHRIQQAIALHEVFSMQRTAAQSSFARPMSFEQVLRKEFPTASAHEYELMLEAVAERESVAKRKALVDEATWTAEERRQLLHVLCAANL